MPTYPSHLRFEPLLDIQQHPASGPSLPFHIIRSIDVLPTSVAIRIGFFYSFIFLTARISIMLTLKVYVHWIDIEDTESSESTPASTPDILATRAPLPVATALIQSEESPPLSPPTSPATSYHEATLIDVSPALPLPPSEPSGILVTVTTTITEEDPNSADTSASVPLALPPMTFAPPYPVLSSGSREVRIRRRQRQRTALEYPSQVSHTPEDAPASPDSSSSPLPSPSIFGPSFFLAHFIFMNHHPEWIERAITRLELRQMLPQYHLLTEENLVLVFPPFRKKLSWHHFMNLLIRRSERKRYTPEFDLLIENQLINYLLKHKEFPFCLQCDHWLILAHFVYKIQERIPFRPHAPSLTRLVFQARPKKFFPHGTRSAMMEFIDLYIRDPLENHLPPLPINRAHRVPFPPPFHHTNALFGLPDPLSLSAFLEYTFPEDDLPEATDRYPDPVLPGYAEIGVFPEDFGSSLSQGSPAPIKYRLLRPYQEVVDLLRFNYHLLRTINRAIGPYVTWNHEEEPIVYIYTLESTIGIVETLWHCYTSSSDLFPILLPPHATSPPPYPVNQPAPPVTLP